MASQELEVYDKITDPMAAVKQLGGAIAKSRMFGCENEAQGEVLAMECMSQRIPPLTLARKYHLIFNRLSQKADDMHSEFLAGGGKSEIVERSAEKCSVRLSAGGQAREFSLTWAEAQQEPFVYEGKESEILKLLAKGEKPSLKAKYQTPRSRMQMLWARVISDGIRALDPRVNRGCYTPEEIVDISESDNRTGNAPTNASMTAEEAMQHAATAAKKHFAATEDGSPIDAEYTVVESPAPCTAEQRDRIHELSGRLDLTDEQRQRMLEKRNAARLRDLTTDQAGELIEKLEGTLAARAKDTAGESTIQTAAPAVQTAGPCTQDQVDLIKTIMQQSADPGVIQQVKDHLRKHGMSRISELNVAEADRLFAGLQVKNLEEFIANSLVGASKQETPKN